MHEAILLIDDEDMILDSISAVLKKEGYKVDCARSGEEALTILKNKVNYDLVITDIRMPGMNGLEVAEQVKNFIPQSKVMVITGYGSLETAVKAQHRGICDYLIKPLDIQGLKNSIQRALKSTHDVQETKPLNTKLKDWTEYLSLTSEFTASLNNSLDPAEILDITLDRLKKITETEYSSLYLFPKVINELYYLKNIRHTLSLSAGNGLCTSMVETMQWITAPVLLSSEDDLKSSQRDERIKPLYDVLRREGLHDAFIMPLIVKDRVMGLVDVCSGRHKPFSDIDVNLMKIITGQTSLALAKALSYYEVEERSKEIGLLYNLSLRLNQSLKITDSIKAICEGAVDITRAAGSLLQTSLEPGIIKNFIFNKDLGFHKEMKRSSHDWLIPSSARKQAFFSNDPVIDARVNSLALYSLGIRSLAYVPLIYEWEDLGGLTVFHKTEGKTFEERDLHLLHLYARSASEVLLNSQLFEAIKKSREKIIIEKNKMDIVLGNMADGVVTMGMNGKITYINGAMQMMLGIKEEDAAGKPCYEIFRTSRCSSECPVKDASAHVNEQKFFEDALVNEDGGAMPVYVSLGPAHDSAGKVSGWVKVVRNIEKIKELDNLKDSFFHALAHDLRAPLTSLMGFVELLSQQEGMPDRQKGYLKIMEDSAHEMNSIITDLLDVYRSKNAGLTLKADEVDMKELVKSAIKEMEGMAGLKGVSLCGLESDDAIKVRADSELIKRALNNLLSNAIKFTPGGGTVRINAKKVGKLDEPGTAYEISVEDSGKGIAQDELDKIFNMFYQGKNNEDVKKSGTGLGLAITREIVEAHGGRIWAESVQGSGTKFKFILPGKISAEMENDNENHTSGGR